MQSKSTDFLKKSHLTKHLANIFFIIVCNADTFILNSQLSTLNFKWLAKSKFDVNCQLASRWDSLPFQKKRFTRLTTSRPFT